MRRSTPCILALLVAALPPATAQRAPVPADTLVAVSAGHSVTCALATSGHAYCWGANEYGEVGRTAGTERCTRVGPCVTRPARVTGGLTFTAVSVDRQSCALTGGGRVYCWGLFDEERVGAPGALQRCGEDIERACARRPVPVLDSLRFASLDIGASNSCALTSAGALYCWAGNSPVRVRADVTFRRVDAGTSHVCGVGTNSAAYCWGSDSFGQLGDSAVGRWNAKDAPVLVSGSLTWESLSAGGGHTCGLTTDGALYCWGDDHDFQLGLGTSERCQRYNRRCSTVPLRVGDERFAAVSAGWDHTCAITSDGRLFCWGSNVSGQLGDTSAAERCGEAAYACSSRPRPVAPDLRFTTVSAGVRYTCALATSRELYCWGANDAGQLGIGSERDAVLPTLVPLPAARPARFPR